MVDNQILLIIPKGKQQRSVATNLPDIVVHSGTTSSSLLPEELISVAGQLVFSFEQIIIQEKESYCGNLK